MKNIPDGPPSPDDMVFEHWLGRQAIISRADEFTALTGVGNRLFKRLSSRPFRPEDNVASLGRFRRWKTAHLEYFLEERRRKLHDIRERFPKIDRLSHPQIGRIRSLQRTIGLIEQALNEREARQSDVNAAGSTPPQIAANVAPVSTPETAVSSGRNRRGRTYGPKPDTEAHNAVAKSARPGRPVGTRVDAVKLKESRGTMSQEEFAEKCGLSLPTIQRGEAGETWDDRTFVKVAETVAMLTGHPFTPVDIKKHQK